MRMTRLRASSTLGVMYENDDFGKDLVKGLKDGLGDKAASMILKEVSYEVTDPTIDSQIITLAGSGADIFFDASLPKFAAQAIRKMYDINWRPLHVLDNGSASVSVVLKPAGLEKSVGIISAQFLKDPANPEWKDDTGYLEWLAFMKQYYPAGDIGDQVNATGYSIAQTIVQVLKQCGDDLTRENLMKQAANIKDLTLPMLIPGIKVEYEPDAFLSGQPTQRDPFRRSGVGAGRLSHWQLIQTRKCRAMADYAHGTRHHLKSERTQARAYSRAVVTEGYRRTIWLAGQTAGSRCDGESDRSEPWLGPVGIVDDADVVLGDEALHPANRQVADEGRLGRRQRSTDAGTRIRTMRGFWLCPTIVTAAFGKYKIVRKIPAILEMATGIARPSRTPHHMRTVALT
jgi:hypothetical protein